MFGGISDANKYMMNNSGNETQFPSSKLEIAEVDAKDVEAAQQRLLDALSSQIEVCSQDTFVVAEPVTLNLVSQCKYALYALTMYSSVNICICLYNHFFMIVCLFLF